MATTKIPTLQVNQIEPHPDNPRGDLGDLAELVESVKAHGVLQPITVVPHPENPAMFRALMGHRRLAAARDAGLARVPVIINTTLDAAGQREAMLIENVHRSDLTPFEEGRAYQGLLDLGVQKVDLARKTGRARTTIDQRLALTTIDQRFEPLLTDRSLTLDQMLAIAEVREASATEYKKLTERLDGGSLNSWAIESARNAIVAKAKRDALVAQAKEKGIPVSESKAYQDDQRVIPLRELGIKAAAHKDCPGNVIHITTDYVTGKPKARHGCEGGVKHHPDEYKAHQKSYSSGYEKERLDRAGRQQPLDEATNDRRDWIRAAYADTTKAGATIRAALATFIETRARNEFTAARPDLGRATPELDIFSDADEKPIPAPKSPIDVLTLALLSGIESDYEPQAPWNQGQAWQLIYAGEADYLRTLINAGYPASDIETAALAAFDEQQKAAAE